jgi:uncharacterized membrane protein SirB2
LLTKKLIKISPHVIDTALLASGLTMAISLGYSLTTLTWFSVKISLVILYIASGIICFKSSTLKIPAAALSTILIFTIIYLAINKPIFA